MIHAPWFLHPTGKIMNNTKNMITVVHQKIPWNYSKYWPQTIQVQIHTGGWHIKGKTNKKYFFTVSHQIRFDAPWRRFSRSRKLYWRDKHHSSKRYPLTWWRALSKAAFIGSVSIFHHRCVSFGIPCCFRCNAWFGLNAAKHVRPKSPTGVQLGWDWDCGGRSL